MHKAPLMLIGIAVLSIFFISCNKTEANESANFAQTSYSKFPVFYEEIENVANYILSCQIPQGGICRNIGERRNHNNKEAFMTTYCFGGVALIKAFQMTGNIKYLDGARNFIDFWMGYQNEKPDRFGVVGTFYDKYVDHKTGEIKNHYYDVAGSVANQGGAGYDASDADGPTIAWTAWEYYKMTADRKYLEQYKENFKLIFKSMQSTVDPADSLTRCHPRWAFKYLMDICEVWVFLGSMENIFNELSESRLADDCRIWRGNIQKTINKNWWNSENNYYYWHLDNGGNYNKEMNWQKWYPDVAEQIWPVLWGVALPQQTETKAVWKAINEKKPNWYKTDLDWPMVSTMAIVMGDRDKAFIHTGNILTKKLNALDFQVNHCYFVIHNCCVDFELTDSIHMVSGSYKVSGNKFGFNFSSIIDGGGSIIIRKNEIQGISLYIDGIRQIIRYENDKIVVPVKVKAGQVKNFNLIF